jgi:hypothetical protein
MCEENEVTVECTDCKKLLCENCSTKHSKKKNHQIKLIKELYVCSFHSKKADYICMDCLEFVCLIRTHHSIQKNHSTQIRKDF